jgi:vanillate O-demethylase ferredoxin subunit
VRVQTIHREAEGIVSLDLRPVEGEALPAFTAGAHVDLHLANGMTRSYSLVNSQVETHRYVVAVQLDARSRGGSSYVHQALRCGDVLTLAAPRNNFPVDEQAHRTTFFAGGIGITPFISMAQRLNALHKSWTLHYFARDLAKAAFLDRLRELVREGPGAGMKLHVGTSPDETRAIIEAAVAGEPLSAHFYCCGPSGMIAAFREVAQARPAGTIHVEHFSAGKSPAAAEAADAFTVFLSRAQREVSVPAGRSILEAVRDAGIDVQYSCEQGVCGACETRVLEGEPDHRDLVLSEAEHAAGRSMMICCSRAKSARLVLDL